MAKNPNSYRAPMRAFSRLTRAALSISAEVERRLKAGGLPVLAWHDVLAELAAAPERRLRPADLAAALIMAQYNLSRLLDRLARAQLVQRLAVDGDARGQWVVLTPSGAAALEHMARLVAHTASETMSEHLDTDDVKKLSKLLRRIIPEPPPQNAAP